MRREMVENQIRARGIDEAAVLEAFGKVERHLFVPRASRPFAYEDTPLPVTEGQTISQPYMTALMTRELAVKAGTKVLEIGTGSGYQAAILAELGCEVYSMERIEALALNAEETLSSLDYPVRIKTGDGTLGWAEHAPYERIIVTAAAPHVSGAWLKQLAYGGRLIVPLGGRYEQTLTVIDKISDTQTKLRQVCGCVFVPLIGKEGWAESES